MQSQQRITDRSFLSWMGGKSLLADRIIPLIPAHRCYIEVFAGAAWLLFKKPESKVEVINDINLDLVTLYRVVQNHLDEFVRYLRWILVSREEFARFKKQAPETLTDIQRAVRFYYLTKAGYASRVKKPTFNISTFQASGFNLLRIEEELSAAHLRLSRVYVENLPYQRVLERFDRPHTFFYLDPPYYGCEDYYGDGLFGPDDFETLASLLAELKGKFILSLNDTDAVRKMFERFEIRAVTTTYAAAAAGNRTGRKELLISNYRLV